jgi:hypothetical protein
MIQVTFKKWGIWQQKSIPFDCFKEAMFFKAKEMGEVLYYLEGLKIDTCCGILCTVFRKPCGPECKDHHNNNMKNIN